MPVRKTLKIVTPPSELEGGLVGRVVKLLDGADGKVGSWRIETWSDGRWVNGGARLSEFFMSSPMSPDELAPLGLPDDAEPSDDPDN